MGRLLGLRRNERPGRRRGLLAGAVVAAIAAAPLMAGTAVAAGTTTVGNLQIQPSCSAASPSGYCTSTRGGGTAEVVDDARANVGRGYLRLNTPGPSNPAASDKAYVFAQAFSGRKLSEITDLEYETYIEQVGSSNAQQAPALNIPINPNKAGATFATLVFEPLYTGTVVPGQWQTWAASSTPSGSGGWWASNSVTGTGTPNIYGFNTYTASFNDVKAALPDAVIAGGLGPNQGGGNDGLRAGVDRLRINDTTIDFENPVVPTVIAPTGGNNQSAPVNSAFAQPLAATVTGAGNAGTPGQPVVFTVTAGSASFGGSPTATVTTGANGVATSPVLTAGPTAGPVTVRATSGALSTTFTETVTPAPVLAREADVSVALTAPATARPGTTLPVTLTLRNAGPIAATQVGSGVTVPAGLRITAAPGGLVSRDGRSVGYLTPSIAAGTTRTFAITVTVDRSVRGNQTLSAGAASLQVRDPRLANNAAQARTTVR